MSGRLEMVYLIAFAATIALCGCGQKPLPVADQATIVTQGSAATVKVFAFGDLKITFPTGVGLKRAAADPTAAVNAPLNLIEAEYRRDLQARTVEYGATFANYAWEKIGKDPERYLAVTDDTSTMVEEDVNYASGSGFVVTSDGNVVTCQHCISGGIVPGYINQKLFDGFMSVLAQKIGGLPTDEVMAKSVRGLLTFLAQHVVTESVFKEARVLIPQIPRDANGYNSLTSEDAGNSLIARFLPSPSSQLKKWTWSSTIVATGENWPGKDVAILKIPAQNLFTVNVSEEPAPRPDSLVLCLGFPGKAVQEGTMTKEAQYRVILHSGRVGQTLPTRSGFDAIHTDADINHGDSGGPALNSSGAVVGLSVSGQEDAPGQNYLVPASVILEKMKEAGVKNSLDQMNLDWRKGLLDLQAKRFGDAKQIFDALLKLQDNDYTEDPNLKVFGKAPKDFIPNTVNLFLDRAIKDCEQGLKAK